MKTPICSFDAKTGILCTKCETKLKSGHLKQAEIEAAIRLTRIAERNQDINKFTMVGAAEVDSDSVLILRGSDISILRANPTLMKEVKEEFQRQVWFIEAEATDRRFMENIFFPCKVQSINLIWLPDGSKLTKVVIESRCDSMVPFDLQQIQKIAQTLRNIELHIEFEKPK